MQNRNQLKDFLLVFQLSFKLTLLVIEILVKEFVRKTSEKYHVSVISNRKSNLSTTARRQNKYGTVVVGTTPYNSNFYFHKKFQVHCFVGDCGKHLPPYYTNHCLQLKKLYINSQSCQFVLKYHVLGTHFLSWFMRIMYKDQDP